MSLYTSSLQAQQLVTATRRGLEVFQFSRRTEWRSREKSPLNDDMMGGCRGRIEDAQSNLLARHMHSTGTVDYATCWTGWRWLLWQISSVTKLSGYVIMRIAELGPRDVHQDSIRKAMSQP